MVDKVIPLRIGESIYGALTFWLVAIAVILTVYSGVDYVVKNKHLITFK
jgi:phosphatidylglycerophosphate synthase